MQMGVAILRVDSHGHAEPICGLRWIERMLYDAPMFAASLRRQWAKISAAATEPTLIELWPGMWVVPLPERRRRRIGASQITSVRHVAMLVGHGLMTCEQFRSVCDSRRVDYLATVARVSTEDLLSAREANRVATTLYWIHEDACEIDRRNSEVQTVSKQLGESYEEISLLYKLSANMTVNQPPAEFLNNACRELQQVLGLRWLALQMGDDSRRIGALRGMTFAAGSHAPPLNKLRAAGRQLLAVRPDLAEPIIVDDTSTLGIDILPTLTRELLAVPLSRDGVTYGLLFGGDKTDRTTQLSSVDSTLCNALANSLAIFIENMMLYEDMQGMFFGTLHALTSSIDAKDSYTHGHSERVALLSRQLAAANGLDAGEVDRVYISGLVHDVGKIGVPESVLCKAGHLTREEYDLIKLHPTIGAEILKDIRQMQDLVPGVLYHHERWDGGGYPSGKAGKDIPLFGRLICLADSFDAMTSNRTYRQALTREQAINEILRCAGSQFDPELAAIFAELDFGPFYDMMQRHHATKSARQEMSLP